MKDLARHLVRGRAIAPQRAREIPRPPRLDSWRPDVEAPAPVEPEPDVVLTGRKRSPPSRVRSEKITFYVSPDEKKSLLRFMKRHRTKTISDAIRDILLDAFENDAPNEKTPPRGGASR
jgi:hypothetical protein